MTKAYGIYKQESRKVTLEISEVQNFWLMIPLVRDVMTPLLP
jgi:hypothetical protein